MSIARPSRKKPAAPKIASRVQDTSRVGRGFRQPASPSGRTEQVAKGTNLEIYDGVEAAQRAGLPMPGQF